MTTLYCILLLAGCALIATKLSWYVLNIAGLPGALLAGAWDESLSPRYLVGVAVTFFGQSYLYLAYVAFVVNGTILAAAREDVFGWVLYPIAFVAAILPIKITGGTAVVESEQTGVRNAQVDALGWTLIAGLIGFFVFLFLPITMHYGWGWLPYMR